MGKLNSPATGAMTENPDSGVVENGANPLSSVDELGGTFSTSSFPASDNILDNPGNAIYLQLPPNEQPTTPLADLAPATDYRLSGNPQVAQGGAELTIEILDGTQVVTSVLVTSTDDFTQEFTTPLDTSNLVMRLTGNGGTFSIKDLAITKIGPTPSEQVTTLEAARTTPTNNDAISDELARDQDAGQGYAAALIALGPTSDATKEATNRTIDYYHQLVTNSTNDTLDDVAIKNRDFWSVLGNMHDGVTPGTAHGINFATWTPRLMLDVWAEWSASGQRTSVIDWIIQTGAGP